MTDAKPYRHRFPITIIQHAVWLYHRFPPSYRDVQELLYRRGFDPEVVSAFLSLMVGEKRF